MEVNKMDADTTTKLIASNLLVATYLRRILRQEKDDPKSANEIKEGIDRIMDDFNAIITAISH
jgi:molecular chaperone GrpE (heat shock protein)